MTPVNIFVSTSLLTRADPGYPKPIANNWLGVWENKIDAALTWKDGKVYFFKGSQYIRYDVAKDQADEGYPADISKYWHGLWEGHRRGRDVERWLRLFLQGR